MSRTLICLSPPQEQKKIQEGIPVGVLHSAVPLLHTVISSTFPHLPARSEILTQLTMASVMFSSPIVPAFQAPIKLSSRIFSSQATRSVSSTMFARIRCSVTARGDGAEPLLIGSVSRVSSGCLASLTRHSRTNQAQYQRKDSGHVGAMYEGCRCVVTIVRAVPSRASLADDLDLWKDPASSARRFEIQHLVFSVHYKAEIVMTK